MKCIKIISWNVNGLNAIEKKSALKWIENEEIDFLFLQETKLSDIKYNFSEKNLNHFIYFSNNLSLSTKGFSGTLSCTKKHPKFESKCLNIDKNFEGRIIEYKYDSLILFNIYFPNGKLNKTRLDYKLNFYADFLKYCIELIKEKNSIIICGDFNTAYKNIDLKKGKIYTNSGFTDIERNYFHNFIENGFIDTFRHINGDVENAYTLFPYRSKAREKNEGWRIDYILISEDLKDKLKDAFILNKILGSDHCPIGIEIDLDNYL